jgi:outer membrane lipoprotein carrier protein
MHNSLMGTRVSTYVLALLGVVSVTLTAPWAAPLAAQPVADAAYERVTKAWAAHTTLEAQFEQKIVNALLGKTATSRGVFLQRKPNNVSITFTDPVGDRIVGDGKSLWVYLPSSAPGQVMKLPADADGAVVADLLGQLLDAPKRTFTISGGEPVLLDGRSTRRVLLVPRTEGVVPFQRATLWLDDKEPRPVRIQVIDGQGIDRTISLTTWVPNASLAKNAFVFAPPKGVKIVTKIPGT